jgi:hypothetical protein
LPLSAVEGPATGKEVDDDGNGTSYEDVEIAGAFDQRFE